jgi:antitoxin FitA
MANVLIRDLDPALVEVFRAEARRNGRSLQAELKLVLEDAARRRQSAFWGVAERLRGAYAAGQRSDSAELVREDRDR